MQQKEQGVLALLDLDKELRELALISVSSPRKFRSKFKTHEHYTNLVLISSIISNAIVNRITHIRQRAKSKNLDFNLSVKWLREKLKIGKCEFTNIPISFDCSNNNHFEIDRINPEKGYVIDNCRVVTRNFNRLKSSNTDDEIYSLAKLVVLNYESKLTI